MKDAEKTIGPLIDKAGVSIISSVDEGGCHGLHVGP